MAQSKEQKNLWQRENGRKNREVLNQIKLEAGCRSCGYDKEAVALEFNHLDTTNKKANISERAGSWSLTRLLEEVAKCEVLCANCHRILTHEQRVTRMGTA